MFHTCHINVCRQHYYIVHSQVKPYAWMPGKGKSIEIFIADCEKVIKNNIMMVVCITSLCQHPVIDFLHTKGFAAMMET